MELLRNRTSQLSWILLKNLALEIGLLSTFASKARVLSLRGMVIVENRRLSRSLENVSQLAQQASMELQHLRTQGGMWRHRSVGVRNGHSVSFVLFGVFFFAFFRYYRPSRVSLVPLVFFLNSVITFFTLDTLPLGMLLKITLPANRADFEETFSVLIAFFSIWYYFCRCYVFWKYNQ